ncbi:Epiplakin [Oryzias melastigma]|uniref:Epiplakin n=1 Tax=Oryzias melastigma TaxID=30732 RepID=A0A834CJG3_ORYME|nr:Epiplakin [Oryzias melastigma]
MPDRTDLTSFPEQHPRPEEEPVNYKSAKVCCLLGLWKGGCTPAGEGPVDLQYKRPESQELSRDVWSASPRLTSADNQSVSCTVVELHARASTKMDSVNLCTVTKENGFSQPCGPVAGTQETLDYRNLLDKCIVDSDTGLLLLPVSTAFRGLRKGISSSELFESNIIDKKTYDDLEKGKTTTQDVMLLETEEKVKVLYGKYAGMTVSLWELLMSEYFDESQRQDFFQKYKDGKLNIKTITEMVLKLIEKSVKTTEVVFEGIRENVTAEQLVTADIISEKVLEDLKKGKKTVKDITEDENVKGKHATLWDLISSEYLSEDKRQELFKLFRSRQITIEQLTVTVVEIIETKEIKQQKGLSFAVLRGEISAVDLHELGIVDDNIYFTEDQQLELIEKYRTRQITKSTLITLVISTIEKLEKSEVSKTVMGIRKNVSAQQLLDSDIIDGDTVKKMNDGKLTFDALTQEEPIKRYLKGTGSIAGIKVYPTQEVKGEFYFFVDEATKLILKSTTTTKAGGKYRGTTVSLWDLLYSKYITEEKRRELVQQYKAGTITITQFMDIVLKIVEERTASQMEKTVVDSSSSKTKVKTTITEVTTFHGIRKDVTASELLESQIIDVNTFEDLSAGKVTVAEISEKDSVRKYLEGTNSIAGVYLQNTKETLSIYDAKSRGEFYFFVDEATKLILKSTTTTKAGGKYRGTTVSLWDLLYSKYITEEKRRELVQQYKAGTITITQFMDIVLKIVEERTASQMEKTVVDSSSSKTKVKTTITEVTTFHGIRKDVTASELLESQIIDVNTFEDLSAGKVTVAEISEKDSVRKYLEGTNSIAGVYLQNTKETLSIYDAKSRGHKILVKV